MQGFNSNIKFESHHMKLNKNENNQLAFRWKR